MNATELQLYDWVLWDTNYSEDDPQYAGEDYHTCRIEDPADILMAYREKTFHGNDVFLPVQLHSYMLKDNGFVERDGDHCIFDDAFELRLHRLTQEWWQATYTDLEEIEDLPPQQVNLKAVNELQHFIRHCHIDIEIDLKPIQIQ